METKKKRYKPSALKISENNRRHRKYKSEWQKKWRKEHPEEYRAQQLRWWMEKKRAKAEGYQSLPRPEALIKSVMPELYTNGLPNDYEEKQEGHCPSCGLLLTSKFHEDHGTVK